MKNKLKIKNFDKIFGWYAIILSIITIMGSVAIFSISQIYSYLGYLILGIIVSLLGLIGGIFLIKKKKGGFVLSLLWSVLQIPVIQGGNIFINFQQFFELHFTFSLNNIVIGINFVGVILLVLLLMHKSKLK